MLRPPPRPPLFPYTTLFRSNRREATALPGAAAFVGRVRGLGGRVVIVTNRTEAECEPTRENLRAVGIVFDAVLCKPDRSEEHTSELQSLAYLVCRLLLEKKK